MTPSYISDLWTPHFWVELQLEVRVEKWYGSVRSLLRISAQPRVCFLPSWPDRDYFTCLWWCAQTNQAVTRRHYCLCCVVFVCVENRFSGKMEKLSGVLKSAFCLLKVVMLLCAFFFTYRFPHSQIHSFNTADISQHRYLWLCCICIKIKREQLVIQPCETSPSRPPSPSLDWQILSKINCFGTFIT